ARAAAAAARYPRATLHANTMRGFIVTNLSSKCRKRGTEQRIQPRVSRIQRAAPRRSIACRATSSDGARGRGTAPGKNDRGRLEAGSSRSGGRPTGSALARGVLRRARPRVQPRSVRSDLAAAGAAMTHEARRRIETGVVGAAVAAVAGGELGRDAT